MCILQVATRRVTSSCLHSNHSVAVSEALPATAQTMASSSLEVHTPAALGVQSLRIPGEMHATGAEDTNTMISVNKRSIDSTLGRQCENVKQFNRRSQKKCICVKQVQPGMAFSEVYTTQSIVSMIIAFEVGAAPLGVFPST